MQRVKNIPKNDKNHWNKLIMKDIINLSVKSIFAARERWRCRIEDNFT